MKFGDLTAKQLTITGVTGIQMAVQGTTGQTGELFQVKNSAGTVVLGVSNNILPTRGLAWEVCTGRLGLTTGNPINYTDVTGATTLYYTPIGGTGQITLYNTTLSVYEVVPFAEISISLSGKTANSNYDAFVVNGNDGTCSLYLGAAWSGASTRGYTLSADGGYMYHPTQGQNYRWVGTIRTNASTGQCDDSRVHRFCWNRYNQVRKILYQAYGASWTYNAGGGTMVTRPTGDTGNLGSVNLKVEFIIGIDSLIMANIAGWVAAASGCGAYIGLQYDGTGSPNWNATQEWGYNSYTNLVALMSRIYIQVGLGYHWTVGVEGAVGTGDNTFWTQAIDGVLMG